MSEKKVTRGSSLTVSLWPQNVPEGVSKVRLFPLNPFEGVWPQGVRSDVNVLESTRDSSFAPVDFPVSIHSDAPIGSLEIGFGFILHGEDGAEIPNSGKGANVTVQIAADAPAGDVDLFIGSATSTDTPHVSVAAGASVPVKFVVMSRDGFHGIVRVTYTTTCPSLSVQLPDGQTVQELSFNVAANAPTSSEALVAAAAGSNGGEIHFAVHREGAVPKSRVLGVQIAESHGGGGTNPTGGGGSGAGGGEGSGSGNVATGSMTVMFDPPVLELTPGSGPREVTVTIARPAGSLGIARVSPRAGQNLLGIGFHDHGSDLVFLTGQTTKTLKMEIDGGFLDQAREIEFEGQVLNTEISGRGKLEVRRAGAGPQHQPAGGLTLEIEPSVVTLNPDGSLVPIKFIVTLPSADEPHIDLGQVETYFNINLTTINMQPREGNKQVYTTLIGGDNQTKPGLWKWYAATRSARTTASLEIVPGQAKPHVSGTLTVEGPHELPLAPGQEARVRVSVRSDGWSGPLRVVANPSSALELTGLQELELREPGDVELGVRAKHNAVVGEGGHRLSIRAEGPDGVKSGRHVIQVPIVGGNVAAVSFGLKPTPAVVRLAPGETQMVGLELDRAAGWDGPVDVEFHPTERQAGEKISVSPQRGTFLPGQKYLEFAVTTKPGAGFSEGSEPSFRVTGRHGQVEREAYVGFAIVDKPLDPISSGLTSFVNRALEENSHVDGVSEGLNVAGDISEGQQSTEQRGLAGLYDSLITDLRNPSSFVAEMVGEETIRMAGLQPADLDRMVWETGILQRDAQLRQAAFQMASLSGHLPLFSVALDGGDTTVSTLPAIRPGQSVNWSEYRTPIEVVVQQMRLAKAAKAAADVTGFTDALLKSIESRWDVTNTDMTPWPHIQAAMKVEAAIGCAVTIADVVAKAIVAFMPNEISDFYAVIDGQYLREPGQIPSIPVDHTNGVAVRAELVTGSPGGEIKSPMEIGLMVADRMLKLRKLSDKIDKLPGEAKQKAAKEIRAIAGEIVKRVQASVAVVGQTPAMKAWADSPGGFWKIQPFKNKPVVITSSKVLNLGSRSPDALAFREVGQGEFRAYGLSVSPQAGYYVGLKKDLIAELQSVSKPSLVKTAVVNVYKKSENTFLGLCRWVDDKKWVKDPAGPCAIERVCPGDDCATERQKVLTCGCAK